MNPPYKHIEQTKNRHGTPVVYFRRGRGVRIRLPDDRTSEEFNRHYFAALLGKPIPHVREMAPTKAELQKQMTEAALRAGLRAAHSRSRARVTPFDLTLDWALQAVERQGFRCALTGIPFFAEHRAASKANPFVPSFDRIDCRRGYTQDNVRIVVYAINAMMLDWGHEVFETVANAYRHRTNAERNRPAPYKTRPAPKKSSSNSK